MSQTLDLAGIREIADRLSVTTQRVHQLSGQDGFPAPVSELACGRIWLASDIEEWIAKTGTVRPLESLSPDRRLPRRDKKRPKDDPWDADAVRFLQTTELGQEQEWAYDELVGYLRQRRSQELDPGRFEEAWTLLREYGITLGPDPGGHTIHFFRSDPYRPHYPTSARERRTWLRQGFPLQSPDDPQS